jgi:hypothetical protein
MSNALCEFQNIPRVGPASSSGKDMFVTATVQGEYGAGVQFTIGMEYCVLAEGQVKTLITILQKRLKQAKGYAATDSGPKRYCPAEKKLG